MADVVGVGYSGGKLGEGAAYIRRIAGGGLMSFSIKYSAAKTLPFVIFFVFGSYILINPLPPSDFPSASRYAFLDKEEFSYFRLALAIGTIIFAVVPGLLVLMMAIKGDSLFEFSHRTNVVKIRWAKWERVVPISEILHIDIRSHCLPTIYLKGGKKIILALYMCKNTKGSIEHILEFATENNLVR